MRTLNSEFLTYEQSLALKELGFDGRCFKCYYKDSGNLLEGHGNMYDTPSPLYQQAFRFFREKYDLFGCIDLHASTPIHWFVRVDKIEINDYLYHSEDDGIDFKTYEEAENTCIDKLIEIVKNKRQWKNDL